MTVSQLTRSTACTNIYLILLKGYTVLWNKKNVCTVHCSILKETFTLPYWPVNIKIVGKYNIAVCVTAKLCCIKGDNISTEYEINIGH